MNGHRIVDISRCYKSGTTYPSDTVSTVQDFIVILWVHENVLILSYFKNQKKT